MHEELLARLPLFQNLEPASRQARACRHVSARPQALISSMT